MADDINGLLQQLQFAKKTKSEVLMVGLCEEICTILCIGSEDHIRVIDAQAFVKVLSEILIMKSLLPELKVFAMRAIALILDIVPRSGPATVAHDVIPLALDLLSQSDVTIQLAEELIKSIECLSLDFPHLILERSGLQKLLLWLEGLESAKERLHIRVISILSNICSRLRHSDWEVIESVFPVLVSILNRATLRLSDTATAREAVGAISGTCLAFAHMIDRLGSDPVILNSIINSYLFTALLDTIRVPADSSDTSVESHDFKLRHCAPTQYSFILRVMVVIYNTNPTKGIEAYQDQRILELTCAIIKKNMQTSPDYASQRGIGDGDDGGQMFMSQVAFNGAAFTSNTSENGNNDKRGTVYQSQEETSISIALEFLSMLLPSVSNSLLDVEILIPFHWWTWEDDYRNFSEFEELVCHELETEYSRQRKSNQLKAVDIIIHGRNSTLRFSDMRQVSRGTGGTRPIYRDPIPCYFVRCYVGSLNDESDDVVGRQKPARTSSRRSSNFLRSNQIHPVIAPPLQSEPSDADVVNATHSSHSDEISNDEIVTTKSYHVRSEKGTSDGSCSSCLEILKQKIISCWQGTPPDTDASSTSADRRVIDTATYSDGDLRSTLLPSTAALDKVIISHITSNPLFLKQLLIHVLPTLIQFLNSSVNANLIKDAVIAITRIISVYKTVIAAQVSKAEEQVEVRSEDSSAQPPTGIPSTDTAPPLSCLLITYADTLSAALVLTISSCVRYSPVNMSDYTRGHLVSPTPGLSVYGRTLSAILVCIDLILSIHGDVFTSHLIRNGINGALQQVTDLPSVLRSRGQNCCSEVSSVEAAKPSHSCSNKRILNKLVSYAENVQTELTSFASTESATKDLEDLHEILNSHNTTRNIIELLRVIEEQRVTPYELLHPNCSAMETLSAMLSDPSKRAEFTLVAAKGKKSHSAIQTLSDIVQRCINIGLPATGLTYSSLHMLTIRGGSDCGRIGSSSDGKAQHISSISLPLRVSYLPAVISSGVMNNIIDRLTRPFFLRCVPMSGTYDDKSEPDQVHTVSVFPFATFGLLEKYINSKKDDGRSAPQPSRHRSSHSGVDEMRSNGLYGTPPQVGASPLVTVDSPVVLPQSSEDDHRDESGLESSSSAVVNPGSTAPHALSANSVTDANSFQQEDTQITFSDQIAIDSNTTEYRADTIKSNIAEASTSSAVDVPIRTQSSTQQPSSPLQSAATISSVSSVPYRGQSTLPQAVVSRELPSVVGPHSPTGQSEVNSVRETEVNSVTETQRPTQVINSPGVHASCAVSLPCTRTLSPAMDPLLPTSPTPSVVLSNSNPTIPLSSVADRGRSTAAVVSTSSDIIVEPPTRSVTSSVHAAFHPQNATTRSSTAAASNHSDGGNQNPLAAVQGAVQPAMNASGTTGTTGSREDSHTNATTDSESDKIFPETELPSAIEFLIDGHVIPSKRLTILDAAILYSTVGLNMRKILTACSLTNQQKTHLGKSMLNKALSLWSGNFVVHYRRLNDPVSGCGTVSSDNNSAATVEIAETNRLKVSLEAGSLTASLQNDICDNNNISNSGSLNPLSSSNLKLASALLSDEHRAASIAINFPSLSPLNQCVGDTRRLVRVVVTKYPLLFPFHLRMQYFDNIVCGARQTLLRGILLPSYVVPLGGAHGSGWISTFRTVLGSQWLRLPGIWSRSSLRKQKVVVSRDAILHCAEVLLSRHATSPLHLDIYFDGEPGTGSGPTTEFFNLVGNEIQRASLHLWRGETDEGGFVHHPNGLFPTVCNPSASSSVRSRLAQSFLFVGRLIGRSIREYKVLNVHFNILFYRLLLGQDILHNASENLELIEPEYERSLRHIESLTLIQPSEGEQHPIDSLELDTVLPGTDNYFIMQSDVLLNSSNAPTYVSRCRDVFLNGGIASHIKAILHGINEVFPTSALQVFTAEELQSIIEGRADDRLWSTAEALKNDIICDHGYVRTSIPIKQVCFYCVHFTKKSVGCYHNYFFFFSCSDER